MSRTTQKLQNGVGAECSVLIRYLHPARLISSTILNSSNNERLEGLLVIKKEEKVVNKKKAKCVVFRHEKFEEGTEIYAVERWVKVAKEGAASHYFDPTTTNTTTNATNSPPAASSSTTNPNDAGDDDPGVELPTGYTNFNRSSDDINIVRALGLDVDDDNDPVPENIPDDAGTRTRVTATTPANGVGLNEGQAWGWGGFDNRKMSGIFNVKPRLKCLFGPALQGISFVGMFLLFLGMPMIDMILVQTNMNMEGHQIEKGEFLRFLGIQLFMSTMSGFRQRDFWSMRPPDVETGAPYRFNKWMSRKRYEQILSALSHCSYEDKPFYRDRFWEVRRMVKMWNENMKDVFDCSWISCLDESMSIWNSKWTCPGWVFCPRKPWPFGNEYHSICCGLSGIMFAIEMVEGKDRPKERPKPDTDKHGPTCGLLLRLCETMFQSGKVVILDSGFCVLQGLIELRKVGVFASAVIKKRRYWPKYVPGKTIDDKMKNEELGATNSVKGKLDDYSYDIFCMKDKDWVMKLMSTYGGLTDHPSHPAARRVFKNNQGVYTNKFFKYKQPFANHYLYRHAVDDHNHLRHAIPSIESTWVTHRWPTRVFTFLLAISEVNAYKAYIYFKSGEAPDLKDMTLNQFRRKLAMSLIHNEYLITEEEATRSSKRRKRGRNEIILHELSSAPPHAKKFEGTKWNLTAAARYQQYVCKHPGCSIRTRNFCKCNPGHWMCKSCFPLHIMREVTSESGSD